MQIGLQHAVDDMTRNRFSRAKEIRMNPSRVRAVASVGSMLVPLALACSIHTEGSGPIREEGGGSGNAGTSSNGGGASSAGSAGNGAAGTGGARAEAMASDGGAGAAGTGNGFTPPPAVVGYETSAATCLAGASTFIDAIAADGWRDIMLTPGGGMAALLTELQRLATEDRDRPVRLRLAPGVYAPTDVGSGEIYLMGLERSASAPLWIQAIDPAPDATRLGQGFNLVAASYLAFEGLTIGPAQVGAYHGTVGVCDEPGSCYHDAPKPLAAQAGIHISGTAVNPSAPGSVDGHLDFSIYGAYRPAHHILIRGVTIQNIFGDDEPSGVGAAGGGSDGIKFNQASDVWVVGSRVRQTSRHAVDNVGVHGGCFQGNVLADSGQGLGIEAKGGSVDVTYDGNVIVNVRRVELGGENTDATYYWSAEEPDSPEHYAYEGRRIVARNNVVVDAREGALEFSGCFDCAAVSNTILFREGFDLGAGGGDAVREVDSHINRDGAGSDCTPLGGETVEPCWGVGPYPADLVPVAGEEGMSRVLANRSNVLGGNLFFSAGGLWGPALSPYNHPNSSHSFGFVTVDYDYWYNGGAALEDPQDGSWLVEGSQSIYTGANASADPGLAGSVGSIDTASASLPSDLSALMRPTAGSPLVGHGSAALPGYAARDLEGRARPTPPSIGAFEPAP
jgi:hypothetical protein